MGRVNIAPEPTATILPDAEQISLAPVPGAARKIKRRVDDVSEREPERKPEVLKRASGRDLAILAGLSVGAFFLDGYHPAVEDAEIYLPGILKRLHPTLFPHNSQFFEAHAHMTLFPDLIAGGIRLLHLPPGIALLGFQVLSIFLLLLGCWRVARHCFQERYAVWCGVALVGGLLRMSAAGSSLYIMDEYLTPRSLSTPGALFAVADALEGKYLRAGIWILLIGALHPLMTVFAGTFVLLLVLFRELPLLQREAKISTVMAPIMALPLFPKVTPAYRQVLETRSYFFLTNWAWYEWLGLLGPFAVLAWIAWLGKRNNLGATELICKALIAFEAVFLALALIISVPGSFDNFAEIQPARCLHLVYILMMLLCGGLLGKFVLRNRSLRWALLFVPICAVTVFAQEATFPATPYVEWPWERPSNPWVQAFDWIRANTPEDAYFAMDPGAMQLPGEDEHGFRAIAQRSLLADRVKDSGAVSMFPALADEWQEQVNAQQGWKKFELANFQKLHARFGVNWVVLEQPGVAGLDCPYGNSRVLVCRIKPAVPAIYSSVMPRSVQRTDPD